MKTAEEIYEENGCNSKRDIIEAIEEYAPIYMRERLDISIEQLQDSIRYLQNKITDFTQNGRSPDKNDLIEMIKLLNEWSVKNSQLEFLISTF